MTISVSAGDGPDDDDVLAIGVMGDAAQRHTGIRFEDRDGTAKLLHLAWHHQLAVWEPPGRMRWVALRSVHPLRALSVHGQCQLVARHAATEQVPYGFAFPDGCFDPTTGRWLLGPDGRGLTCATFVVAVLKTAGVDLVDLESWEERQDDVAWKTSIIDTLKKDHPKRAIALASEEPNGFRLRPEEAAGSANADPLPTCFADAVELGRRILDELLSR